MHLLQISTASLDCSTKLHLILIEKLSCLYLMNVLCKLHHLLAGPKDQTVVHSGYLMSTIETQSLAREA